MGHAAKIRPEGHHGLEITRAPPVRKSDRQPQTRTGVRRVPAHPLQADPLPQPGGQALRGGSSGESPGAGVWVWSVWHPWVMPAGSVGVGLLG